MTASIKAWLLLAGIFVFGVVTGSALTFGLGAHFLRSRGEMEMRAHWLPFLVQQLQLTPEQRIKIRPVIIDAVSKIQVLHREEVGRGAEIFKSANEQILTVLTPEQKVELQKLELDQEKLFLGHMRAWRPQREGPGGPPDGNPGMFQRPGGDNRMTPPSFMENPTHVPPPPPDSSTNAPGPTP